MQRIGKKCNKRDKPGGTLRNPPKPSATFRNLPQPSATFRNLPQPSATFRNLPQPSVDCTSEMDFEMQDLIAKNAPQLMAMDSRDRKFHGLVSAYGVLWCGMADFREFEVQLPATWRNLVQPTATNCNRRGVLVHHM